ncbi:vWA domain-containing protein [Frankia sp. CiP1_Cm_nod1]|uniref:vWA domain-containing protein n=1 Tax=Frankia sp. CiP1_Cm_nod1 TaxID=2897160 RepID=UPI0020258E71
MKPAVTPVRWLTPVVTALLTVLLTALFAAFLAALFALLPAIGGSGTGLGLPAASAATPRPAALPPEPAPDPQPGVPQMDRAAVMAALHVDDVPADYVVLVDTSASMAAGGLAGQVSHFLRGFVAGLAPSDRFVLIGFDVAPAVLYAGPAAGAAGAVDRLPRVPTGTHTDIGAAVREAVDELGRHDASPVAAVFLLTDGRHQPPPNSGFPTGDDRPWQLLGDDARQRLDVTKVHGYGVALRDDDQARDGAGQLKRALPTTTVLALPTGQLPAYLDRAKDDTRRRKAANLLEADVRGQVVVSWDPQLADVDPAASPLVTQVTLTSRERWLPLELTDVSVTSSDRDVWADGIPSRITLEPGHSVTVPVTLSWKSHTTGRLRGSRTVTSELRLGANIDSSWRNVTESDFKLPLQLRLAGESSTLYGSSRAGWNFAGLLLLALLAAAGLGAAVGGLLWWYPKLTGVLSAEWPDGQIVRAELSGRRVRIGPGRRLDVPGLGSVRGRRARSIGELRRTDIFVCYQAPRPAGKPRHQTRRDGKTRYQPRRPRKPPRLRFSPGDSWVIGDTTFIYTGAGQADDPFAVFFRDRPGPHSGPDNGRGKRITR